MASYPMALLWLSITNVNSKETENEGFGDEGISEVDLKTRSRRYSKT